MENQASRMTPASLTLRVVREASAAGVVTLAPVAQHRIKVHASGATPGECAAAPFVYARGDIDIVPAGEADGWLQHEASESLMLSVPVPLLNRTADELGLASAQVVLEPRNHLRDARIEHIAWALEADRTEGHPAGALFADSLGVALAAHLLRHYRKAPIPRARGLSKAQLQRVREYVDTHLNRDLALDRLAGVAGLSVSHFKTLFRRSTGLPVHAYVVQRRVEHARSLLSRGGRSISQVALDAGFAHPSHMARTMRKLLGVAPSALLRDGARLTSGE